MFPLAAIKPKNSAKSPLIFQALHDGSSCVAVKKYGSTPVTSEGLLPAYETIDDAAWAKLTTANECAWAMPTGFQDYFSTAVGAARAHGALLFQWRPTFGYGDLVGDFPLLKLAGSGVAFVYADQDGRICVTDGINEAVVNIDFLADTSYWVCVRWSSLTSAMSVSAMPIAGAIVHGDAASFDGAFALDGYLLAPQPTATHYLRDLKIYNKHQLDAWVETACGFSSAVTWQGAAATWQGETLTWLSPF